MKISLLKNAVLLLLLCFSASLFAQTKAKVNPQNQIVKERKVTKLTKAEKRQLRTRLVNNGVKVNRAQQSQKLRSQARKN